MKGNATMAILPLLATESCNMSADHTAHLTKHLTNLLPYCLLRQKKAPVDNNKGNSVGKQDPNNQDNQDQDDNSGSEYGNNDQSQTYKPTKVSPLQQATSKHSASSCGPNSSTTNPAKKPRQSPREPLHAHIPNVPHTPGPEEGEDHKDDMVVHHNYYQCNNDSQPVIARGIWVHDVSLWNIDPKKHTPKDKGDISSEFQNVIKEEGLWSKVKFVQSNKEYYMLAHMIMESGHWPTLLEGTTQVICRNQKEFTTKNEDIIMSTLNTLHQNNCSKLKAVGMGWMNKHGGRFPEITLLQRCIKQMINHWIPKDNDPQFNQQVHELQVFAWWVDKVLPAACHNSHHFPQDKRMFIQVLKYAPTDKPSQPYVSTSNEAFALLYFEGMDGNLRRWWNKKQAHLDKSLKLCDFATYRKNNPGKGDHPKEAPNVRYVDHKTHGNKWTILNGGQQKNGSWKDAAIKHFRECKVLATNGCQACQLCST
jgi:hypothetical protein